MSSIRSLCPFLLRSFFFFGLAWGSTIIDVPVVAAACGDSIPEAGETCDDGNLQDGDGCSSRCQIEAWQTTEQQVCINALNLIAQRVAQAQASENLSCVKNASRARLPEGQTIADCLEADSRRKILRVAIKLKVAQDGEIKNPAKSKCPETPDFAYVDDEIIVAAITQAQRDFLYSVLGSDLEEATVEIEGPATAKLGACQRLLLRAADKIVRMQMREFALCKKRLLKDANNPAISAVDLEKCFDAVASDDTNRIERARLQLLASTHRKCVNFGYGVDDALDGDCAETAADLDDFSHCVVKASSCTVCKIFNGADGLAEDCDAFDDGAVNESCHETSASSPQGAFVDGPILAQL